MRAQRKAHIRHLSLDLVLDAYNLRLTVNPDAFSLPLVSQHSGRYTTGEAVMGQGEGPKSQRGPNQADPPLVRCNT